MRIAGNQKLIETKKAAILNSSQSKLPCGNDSWIKAANNTVEQFVKSGYTLLTSIGLNTWEIIVHLTSIYNGDQIICIADDNPNLDKTFNDLINRFNLNPEKTALICGDYKKSLSKPKTNWLNRDKMIFEMADLLVPVSIKRNGKLEKLIYNSEKTINSNL